MKTSVFAIVTATLVGWASAGLAGTESETGVAPLLAAVEEHVQPASPGVEDGKAVPESGLAAPDAGSHAESLPDLLVKRFEGGDSAFDTGRHADALADYRDAQELANLLNDRGSLADALQSQARVYWALHEQSGSGQAALRALGYWTAERATYEQLGYPRIHAALAAYDVGRAHLALSALRYPGDHSQEAARAFDYALSLPEAEREIFARAISGGWNPHLPLR